MDDFFAFLSKSYAPIRYSGVIFLVKMEMIIMIIIYGLIMSFSPLLIFCCLVIRLTNLPILKVVDAATAGKSGVFSKFYIPPTLCGILIARRSITRPVMNNYVNRPHNAPHNMPDEGFFMMHLVSWRIRRRHGL